MPLYESTFICRQDMSKQDVAKVMDEYSDIVKEKGGSVVKSEYWGLRSLAYRINKSRRGHYHMLGLDTPPAAIDEIRRRARISDDVMRHVDIRVDEISKEPSAPMKTNRDTGEEQAKAAPAAAEAKKETENTEE